MFEIDARDVKKYEADLKNFAGQALPYASRAMLTRSAFEARRRTQDNIRERMTTRNKFTVSSIRVEKARSLNIKQQEAVTGSIAEYLETQEFGGMETGGGKYQPIPTSYSAGQGRGAKRTKLPRKPNRMQAIQLKNRAGAGLSRKARNQAAIQQAAGGGNKFVFLDLGRRQGIFKVTGGKRKPKVQMVWDMTRRSVRIPRTPTLGPATTATQQVMPQFYAEALVQQLKRRKILGYR